MKNIFRNKDSDANMSDTEKRIFEQEIERLNKENKDLRKLLAIAEQYKEEYQQLCTEYKERTQKLDELIQDTKNLKEEINKTKYELDKL